MKLFRNRICQRIFSLLLVLCFFVFLDTCVGELLRPVTYATYFNQDISEIERSNGNADLLFIGASRTYRTFVPQVFEDILKLDCVVNAGSSSQPICGTYYELKDLIDRIHPRKVLIGVIWNQLTMKGDLQSRLIVYDRLSMRNRIEMAANCISLSEVPYLSAVYRFKDNFSLKKINSNIAGKKDLASLGFKANEKGKEYYADTGFVYSKKSYQTGNIPIKNRLGFSADRIREDNLKYLDACIELCRKNNIEVGLVTGVTSMMRLYTVDHYQDAVDYYQDYAEKQGIDYYNLNYLVGREEFLPDEMMHDYNHTNGEGARVASEKLAEVLLKADAGEDVSSYFYQDLDELKKHVHRIVAVKARIHADSEDQHHYCASVVSLQNDDVDVVYRILARDNAGKGYTVLRNWTASSDIDFYVDDAENCTVRVEAGSADPSYGHAYQEYSLKGLN